MDLLTLTLARAFTESTIGSDLRPYAKYVTGLILICCCDERHLSTRIVNSRAIGEEGKLGRQQPGHIINV